MSLNENLPSSTSLMSEMDDYQRETRAFVNDLDSTISGEVVGTAEPTSFGSNTYAVGAQMIQVLFVDGDLDLQYLTGGNAGMLVFILLKAGHTLTVHHSAAQANGDIYLNSGVNLSMSEYDMLLLCNQGGDSATGVDGYWRELTRNLWV